jgi:hypothetical protein
MNVWNILIKYYLVIGILKELKIQLSIPFFVVQRNADIKADINENVVRFFQKNYNWIEKVNFYNCS